MGGGGHTYDVFFLTVNTLLVVSVMLMLLLVKK